MLYDWNTTVCAAEYADLTPAAPLTLTGSGFWTVLVSSGSCTAAGNPPQAAAAGTLILSRSPLALEPGDACHLLAVRLTGTAAEALAAALPEGAYIAKGESCPRAAELLAQLNGESDSRRSSQLAFALLCELADADAATPPLPPLVAQAMEDIRQHYAGLYGVEELSERLGVSKSHLIRAFHAAVGISPGKYLTSVRIEAAKRLLLQREHNLDIIASLCGFSGANYLCRAFRREVGLSPSAWRARVLAAGGGFRLPPSAQENELYV